MWEIPAFLLSVIQTIPYIEDKNRLRKLQDFSDDLRTIFFSPQGTLSTIDILLSGRHTSPAEVALFIRNFDETEEPVSNALRRLKFSFDKSGISTYIRDDRALSNIKDKKISIRRRVELELFFRSAMVRRFPWTILAN